MGDFLPEFDAERRKTHEERVQMMQEREEMGDFGPESPRNVRVLHEDEVREAQLDALRTYRDKLEDKLEMAPSSPLSTQLEKVNAEIRELESRR